MKVSVVSRSGREVVKGGVELSDSATVADLQEEIHRRSKLSRALLSLNIQNAFAVWAAFICSTC
ncbi:hypothetical protein BT93_L4191 [Corymbia citriodora subsp. variegata]|uniref:ubiquitinyl hydrolase 1 n=1 Tax=Corymbia citriodora subsp. variegata TaxID=360336 RepID=A0A8T0CIB2_CORYI|nr:hypothetical protein BT93_L4191 [Corymbia citriodora subsp. variegata]